MRAKWLLRAAAAALALGVLARVRQELAEFRRCDAALARERTLIDTPEPLSMHARVAESVRTPLPPIVLVHGYGIGSSYFVPLAARLARRARVFVPELPGHGASQHASRPLSIAALAAALVRWMETRGLRGALLVGHSSGCQTVLEAAALRPGLVGGVVLIGPTLPRESRSYARVLARAVVSSLFERPSAALWMARDYRRAGIRVLAAELRNMLAYRPEQRLPAIGVPVLVVRGARDLIAPQAWAEHLARLAGAPPPIVVPGWGHAVHYDAPQDIARLLIEAAERMTGLTPSPAPG